MQTLRQARTRDHGRIVGCIQDWWGDSRTPQEARELSLLLPRLFLQHFASTSLVLADGVPVHRDYDGPGQDRVCLHRLLDPPVA